MLWFFFMIFVFLCFYKIRVLLGTTHFDDPPPIQNTPMPSSSSPRSYSYDVFLSFRGEDTRKKFVDHLYKALKDRLIHTYKDDITLPRGESVGPALLEAIEESHIAVIVFSKNYADSSWCLDELVHIMKCRADPERGLIVIPIFYDVEPTEVRKQKGEFGEAFAKLTKMSVWRKLFAKQEKTKSWKNALVDASNISGWEPKNVANGHEAAVIQKIIDKISLELLSPNSDIDKGFVGMTDRVKDLVKELKIGMMDRVRMVGIWGVGGGGKTTLATSVYMKIKDRFQGHCIVDNVRGASKHGRTTLQAKILSTLLNTQVVVQSEEEGKCLIESRLCHSNVLILLDDVDDLEQLEALAGSHSWFGPGSRIIITTRNEHLLQKVDYVSPVRLLSQDEGNRLFKKHAYNDKKPLKDYGILSLRVVSYAHGLPLALKVLGSFLYDKDEKEWMSALERLKNIPQDKILEKLQISYDGLIKVEQELFLDIACLFRHRRKDDAMEIFEACGFHPDIGIKVLIQKALITINLDGEFDMHDLVQEMGHYIVRGKHPDNPEKHSRVWKYEDISNMCLGDTTMKNYKIEAIWPQGFLFPSQFYKFVSNLKKLRWIQVIMFGDDNVEAPNFLSNELRYVEWEHYPASPFPDSFQPMNLVVLKMKYSFQKELWRSPKHLPQLKVLQLHDMRKLVSTPNFDGLPCLQKLELCDCYDLEEIHPSIGNHRSLESVKVSSCHNLRIFPTIFMMEKLKVLQLRQMEKLVSTPNFDGLPCLQKLELCYCSDLEEIHPSIGNHRSLTSVKVSSCPNLRIFPTIFKMEKLEVLHLCALENLVSTPNFDELPCLRKLKLRVCSRLEEIHPSIGNHRSLKSIKVSDCTRLRMFPTIFKMEKLKLLEICFCHKSLEFPNIQANMESLVELNLAGIGIEGLLSSIGERCTSLISLQLYICFRICVSTQPGKMLLPQCLQRLNLVNCFLEDGEVHPAIGEISNLQELNLMYNNFSKLHFSISQLTRLKHLNLSGCPRLLELPQLPSSIATLLADGCDSLTDVGDFYVDCKRLWYASLICSNVVIDGNRFLESMLQGENAENQCVTLQLQGLEIPKGFTPCLREGSECTLQLPENWCSDFCGFLMCIVWRNDFRYMSFEIIMEQVITGGSMSMDSEDDVVWKESDSKDDVVWKESVGDEITWVGYFPFASLRHTEWWDSTYKKDSLSINFRACPPGNNNVCSDSEDDVVWKESDSEDDVVRKKSNPCSGFGVRLIRRKGGSGPTETSEEISTDSSGIYDGKDDYTTRFEIKSDSKDYLKISPRKFEEWASQLIV